MYQQVTLEAGVAVEFQEAADFFRLMASAPTDVEVIFYAAGREVSRATAIEAGYAERFAVQIDRVRITSVAGGAIAFVLRLGNEVRYDKAPSGTVSGTVAVSNLGATQGAYSRAAIAAQDAVTAGTILAANAARRYCLVQNNDATKYLRLRVDGTAPTTSTGIRIAPGGYWESSPGYAPNGAIKVIAETAGGIAVEALEG